MYIGFDIIFFVPFIQEALKCTVDLLDILGMYFVITKLLGRSEMKIMVTAVGECVCVCVCVCRITCTCMYVHLVHVVITLSLFRMGYS